MLVSSAAAIASTSFRYYRVFPCIFWRRYVRWIPDARARDAIVIRRRNARSVMRSGVAAWSPPGMLKTLLMRQLLLRK